MALNFTDDIMDLYATTVANDANYQSPGNYGLVSTGTGETGVTSVTIDTPGTYTTVPAATAGTGAATFSTRMALRSASAIAAAGTGYGIGNVLSLSGGTKTTTATVTVATAKLVSATIVSGGTGYGAASTFTVSVAGGTHSVTATLSVTTSAGGVVTTINSVSAAGNYTVLPTLTANAATGDNGTDHGTGLSLDLVFGVNSFTLSAAGIYSALPSNPISVTGGTGTGFTLTGSWEVQSLVITDAGSYEPAAAPTITFGSGSAAATAHLAAQTGADENEQKVIMMVEIIRSLLAEADGPVQVKDLHEVIRKMLATMRWGSPIDFDSSAMAQKAVNAAMNYIAKNQRHLGANLGS